MKVISKLSNHELQKIGENKRDDEEVFYCDCCTSESPQELYNFYTNSKELYYCKICFTTRVGYAHFNYQPENQHILKAIGQVGNMILDKLEEIKKLNK